MIAWLCVYRSIREIIFRTKKVRPFSAPVLWWQEMRLNQTSFHVRAYVQGCVHAYVRVYVCVWESPVRFPATKHFLVVQLSWPRQQFSKVFCSMSHQPAFMKLCDEIGAETFAPLIIFQMTNWLSRKHRKMWSFKKFNFSSWDTYISLWNIAKFYLDLSLSKYF